MISSRIQQVQSPVIPIVGRLTAETPGTISLGQGVVNYDPPQAVFQAVADAARTERGIDRYGPVVGNDELIALIQTKLANENGLDLASRSCTAVCTAGANMGFLNAVLSIADLGDEIILLSPYYFNHHMAIEMAGCRPVIVDTDPENQPDVDAIADAVTPRTKGIVTVSPNNPTGAVYTKSALQAINHICADRGLYHICDEAYEYFLFDGLTHFSPASETGAEAHTISIYSLSKAYALAGWRMGYSVVPNHLVDAIRKVQDTNLICPPIVCQRAAAVALQSGADWCRERISPYQDVRDLALQTLRPLAERCQIATPQGAFYLFMRIDTDQNDMDLVESLIRQHAVAVLPGSAFGVRGGCSLRISYGALDAESALKGVGRLRDGLLDLLETN